MRLLRVAALLFVSPQFVRAELDEVMEQEEVPPEVPPPPPPAPPEEEEPPPPPPTPPPPLEPPAPPPTPPPPTTTPAPLTAEEVKAQGQLELNHNLFHAISNGLVEDVSALIKAGANVNEKQHDGWTPLMVAMIAGYEGRIEPLPIAKLLLEAKSDLNIVDSRQRTALYFAAKNDKKVLDLFKGAKELTDPSHSQSALGRATLDGSTEMMEALVLMGHHVEHSSSFGGVREHHIQKAFEGRKIDHLPESFRRLAATPEREKKAAEL